MVPILPIRTFFVYIGFRIYGINFAVLWDPIYPRSTCTNDRRIEDSKLMNISSDENIQNCLHKQLSYECPTWLNLGHRIVCFLWNVLFHQCVVEHPCWKRILWSLYWWSPSVGFTGTEHGNLIVTIISVCAMFHRFRRNFSSTNPEYTSLYFCSRWSFVLVGE